MDDDLRLLLNHLGASTDHGDLLFLALCFTGFHGLLRLGEAVWPDRPAERTWRKVTMRHTAHMDDSRFGFHLPAHKTDRAFEGYKVLIDSRNDDLDPLRRFRAYLSSRDRLFPKLPALWLTSQGRIPTRQWFMNLLRRFFGKDVAGHSLRAGGAMALALAGIPDDRIQAIGRWTSETYCIYIRKHPTLLHALLHNGSAFTPS